MPERPSGRGCRHCGRAWEPYQAVEGLMMTTCKPTFVL